VCPGPWTHQDDGAFTPTAWALYFFVDLIEAVILRIFAVHYPETEW
jgi:hypothetical protein